MDYLTRESAPFSPEMWTHIDNAVLETARKHMVCRRFLNLFGPLGPGVTHVPVDNTNKEESLNEGFGLLKGRRLLELPILYEDFTLYWRDLETAFAAGRKPDLSAALAAAQRAAKREDNFILFGHKELEQEGLFNATDSIKMKRGDWTEGENAFHDIAHGIAYLSSKNFLGRYALVLSPDLYLNLQRIIPNINILESERIAKLVDGRVYATGAFGAGKAVLVCAEPQYMDLAVGCDMNTGYLETKDFNHALRIQETVALRIKEPAAIVNFVTE